MKLERLDLQNFKEGIKLEPGVTPRVFIPSGSKRVEEAPPPPPPVYNEEDIKTAERDGFKKGFLDGVQEGRRQAESEQAEVDRHLVAMAERFSQAITPLFDHYKQMVMALQQDLPKGALAIARKVAGDALEARADAVIADIITRCCQAVMNEPEITITAHESMGDTLERKLKEMTVKLPASTHIIIVRDPNMPKEDCRIEWKQGAMERITNDLWKQMERITNDLSAIAAREATQAMQALEEQLPKPDETHS